MSIFISSQANFLKRYGNSIETPSTTYYSSNIFLTLENQKNLFHKRVFF
jgi:hypothetical protein